MKIVCNLLNGSFNKSVANILPTILSVKGGCLILCPELADEQETSADSNIGKHMSTSSQFPS